jgi:hypothetical protein
MSHRDLSALRRNDGIFGTEKHNIFFFSSTIYLFLHFHRHSVITLHNILSVSKLLSDDTGYCFVILRHLVICDEDPQGSNLSFAPQFGHIRSVVLI